MSRREQLPLFDSPATPMRYRPSPATPKARYTKRGHRAARALCDDCCADIHRLGQELAPYPKVALWRRADPDGNVLLLCQAHKDRRADDEAS